MAHIAYTADNPTDAIKIQRELASRVLLSPLPALPKTIAGADVSLERFGTELFAGIIVLSYPALETIEHAVVKLPVSFPYIPGLLSFREIPGLVQCFHMLGTKPDIIMVDGQGIAHPRRLGIATHLGLVLDIPTIGCAKSRLYGSYVEPYSVGEEAPITDPKTNEVIGVAYKSKERSNPLIISPGHLMTIDDSLRVVQGCLRGYRLPEPTRKAHELVNRFRKGEML
jgi:deoxyribonuclease V